MIGALGLSLMMCGGSDDKAKEAPAKEEVVEEKVAPTEPVPSLIVVQAQFEKGRPLPARLVLLRRDKDNTFYEEAFEDPEANVFHKGVAWRDGILTIGAERSPKPATLKHWTRDAEGNWTAETLWSKAWEGSKFNRFRDIELADVNGDGKEDLVIATHDRGVVAVGSEVDGAWVFSEFDETADTFVHEIEIGDVDGDGKKEFYATPSARNRASGASQPGSVVRYDFMGPEAEVAFVQSTVVDYEESHAKEILVTDIDGNGVDELYVVREGHVVKDKGATKLVDPVRVVRFTKGEDGWIEETVASFEDKQSRFLLSGDVTNDGKTELILAGMKSGLWMLTLEEDGSLKPIQIDAKSGGFEHATHVADLDNDGKLEIYVAADEQKQFRQYIWSGENFKRTVIGDIGPAGRSYITWNIQDGVF